MIELNHIGAAAFIAVRDDEGSFCIAKMNSSAERMTGLTAADVVQRPLAEVLPAEIATTLGASFALCMDEQRTVDVQQALPTPAGTIFTRITLTPILDEPGQPVRRLLGVSIDVTQQQRLQEDLRASNARLGIAMEALGGAHWYFDNEQQRFELSPAFERILGNNTPREMGIEEWQGHVHPDDRNDTCFADILAGRSEGGTAEFRVFGGNGDVRWLRCRRQAVASGNQLTGIAGVVLDITQEKRREAVLSLQATSDPLTGLYNRRRFEEVFAAARESALKRRGALSLLMVDVDFFKRYNDTYGHIEGDVVLRKIAACLESVMRRWGGTAARYGGEEFIALLPGQTTAQAAAVAEQILQEIAELNQPHRASPSGRISVSIGVAGDARVSGSGAPDLIALADSALYRAKNDGRNCYRVRVTPRLQEVSTREAPSAA